MNIRMMSLLVFLNFVFFPVIGQTSRNNYIKDLILRVDTSVYQLTKHTISVGNERHLYFSFSNDDEVCEIRLYPNPYHDIHSLSLQPSGDFDIIDSVLNINNEYFRFKVRFKELTRSQFLNFTFFVTLRNDTIPRVQEIKLFPYTKTFVRFYPPSDEIFIGEEKVFELVTNNVANIRTVSDWATSNDIDYRVTERGGQLRLHILPKAIGRKTLTLNFQTVKPYLDDKNKPVYDMPKIEQQFFVKASRLAFLNIDKPEVTFDDETRTSGIEIQLDDHRNLQLNKTYRIENQEAPGGPLIAELYTRSKLANNRVLCILRVFNYHRKSDGYLYIKDGDDARFVTNFSITPKTTIQKISILHEGVDWSQDLSVHPGEIVDVRIEGEALHKARFHFEDAIDMTTDTMIRSESVALFKLKFPMDVSKRRLTLYNHAENTGYSIQVKEYQIARPFDYIQVNYGDINRNLHSLKSPVLYKGTVRDVVFSFVPRRIDEENLHGRQHLKIDVKIYNRNNQLMEIRTIDNIIVCPGTNSPRYQYYDSKGCVIGDISLNSYLSRNTFDLEEWSKIELTIENKKDKHGGEGHSKKLEIYLRKDYTFDIDVSFPAGLLTVSRQTDDDGNKDLGFGSLGGISMAVVAQFSFYHSDRIARYKPYKIGAGFLAMNAFSFRPDDQDRAFAAVILGSVYPTSRDVKLSFPLFVGGGYYLMHPQNAKFFFLIGPGIRVRL